MSRANGAKGMRLARQGAFCTCLFLGIYLGLGGRAWDYGFAILDPRTDFILAVVCAAAVMAFGRRVESPLLIVGSAILAGSLQLLVDAFWLTPAWPETVYLVVGLSILVIGRQRPEAEPGAPARHAAIVLATGGLAKGATAFLPGFGFQGIYSLQFILTWGLILFGVAMLAGEAVRLIANRLR